MVKGQIVLFNLLLSGNTLVLRIVHKPGSDPLLKHLKLLPRLLSAGENNMKSDTKWTLEKTPQEASHFKRERPPRKNRVRITQRGSRE